MTSLNHFWGLLPMYASSLPCRAENNLYFNPTSPSLSIHLFLLALHGKIFLQVYIFLALFLGERLRPKYSLTPCLTCQWQHTVMLGLPEPCLEEILISRRVFYFPHHHRDHHSMGLSGQSLHPPLCPAGAASLMSHREYP